MSKVPVSISGASIIVYLIKQIPGATKRDVKADVATTSVLSRPTIKPSSEGKGMETGPIALQETFRGDVGLETYREI